MVTEVEEGEPFPKGPRADQDRRFVEPTRYFGLGDGPAEGFPSSLPTMARRKSSIRIIRERDSLKTER